MEHTDQLLTDVILLFFKHQLKIKMYHFQTKLYGSHKTADAYLEKFENNLDKFMEVAQGISEYGKLSTKSISIVFDTLTDDNISTDLTAFIGKFMTDVYPQIKKYPDLTTIADEIVADIHQFIYLLTFK